MFTYMTQQEEIKKFFISYLKKKHKNMFLMLYKEYYKDENIRYLCDMFFKTYNPIFMFSILGSKSNFKNYLNFRYEMEYALDRFISLNKRERFNRMVFINLGFKATTKKEKQKLLNFCLKYGIIHYTHQPINLKEYLEKIIQENDVFLIDTDLTIHYGGAFMSNDLTLNKLIYLFEKEANKVNNIQLPLYKRIYYRIKYGK